MGYVVALHDFDRVIAQAAKQSTRFDAPTETTFGQLVKVFVKYADTHPEFLHEPAVRHVLQSLAEAFSPGK